MLRTLMLITLLGCGDKSPTVDDCATQTKTGLQATATASEVISTVVFVSCSLGCNTDSTAI